MNATSVTVRPGGPGPSPSVGNDGPRSPRRLPLLVQGGVLVTSLVAAGVLFWGTPAGTADLPDPDAMSLLAAGHDTSAENVAFWTQRVADDPDSSPAITQLAAAQLALAGDTADLAGYEVAAATAERAIGLTPDQENARLVLARSLAGQHAFEAALALAEEVLEQNPVSVSALLAAGDAQLELGNDAAARERYDEARTVVGGAAPILSRYARLEALTGSLEQAEDLARRALIEAGGIDLRNADAAFYWFQLATFEFNRGNADAARTHLEAALSIDARHPGSTELLAKTLAALGDEPGAIAIYEQLVDNGKAADLHGELAKLYERAGRPDEARRQIELGLEIAAVQADRFPAERRHLIGFLADHDPQNALRLAELDLAERGDVHTHAWYAWALLQAGRPEEAAAAIAPALVFGTQDAWLWYQAGSILAAVGDDGAREMLEAALDLNPGFDVVHAARARELAARL